MLNFKDYKKILKKCKKKRGSKIDFKLFLKISHIVCCQKNMAILRRIAKIVFKAFFYLSNKVIV